MHVLYVYKIRLWLCNFYSTLSIKIKKNAEQIMANWSTNTVSSGEKAGHLKESKEGFLYEVVDKIKDQENYSKLSMVTMNTDTVYATATTPPTVMKSSDSMNPLDSSEMPPTAPMKASGKYLHAPLPLLLL